MATGLEDDLGLSVAMVRAGHAGLQPGGVDLAPDSASHDPGLLAACLDKTWGGQAFSLDGHGSQPVARSAGCSTAREAGIEGMDFNQWWAVDAPATTRIEIVDRLRAEVVATLNHPATRQRLNTLGIDLKGSTRDELRSFMRNEVDRWGAIARSAGVKPE